MLTKNLTFENFVNKKVNLKLKSYLKQLSHSGIKLLLSNMLKILSKERFNVDKLKILVLNFENIQEIIV